MKSFLFSLVFFLFSIPFYSTAQTASDRANNQPNSEGTGYLFEFDGTPEDNCLGDQISVITESNAYKIEAIGNGKISVSTDGNQLGWHNLSLRFYKDNCEPTSIDMSNHAQIKINIEADVQEAVPQFMILLEDQDGVLNDGTASTARRLEAGQKEFIIDQIDWRRWNGQVGDPIDTQNIVAAHIYFRVNWNDNISGGASPSVIGSFQIESIEFGSEEEVVEEEPVALKDFKIVGYLPSYRFYLNDKIEYDKLTHLNISFVNPDSMGQFAISEDPRPIIERARQLNPNIKILFSIAGGALTEEWRYAYKEWKKEENRTAFIHNLMTFTRQFDVDGLDVDLEWQDVDENYSAFAIELSDSLLANNNMLMTAALPPTTRFANITDAALERYDFINMMAYDEYGPWRPDNGGQHSSFAFAEAGVNFWKVGQGLSNKNLTLGVPFYGYDFTDPNRTFSVTYGQMVAQDTTYTQLDQVGEIYYNGIPTIKTKLALARQRVGGIMIWELGQDAFDEYAEWSLLRTIFNELNINTYTAEILAKEMDLSIYPNPFSKFITIETKGKVQLQSLTLTDVNGRILLRQSLIVNPVTISLPDLPKGMYFAIIESVDGFVMRRLVRQ